ncbi:putative Ig-like domain-containing protein [Seiridium cardinale]|uniref:Ig-like domain-containing protein n=1 Tax=Seiridium cardinale TaxID=138064 RepID=A0ABR2XJM3_9PEZI
MTSPSDASSRAGPLSPPTPSITAYPAKRTISPGVYICKGEGHSIRHSWILGGRLVDFAFPETRKDHHGPVDEQQRPHNLEEGTRPPISIPGASARRRTGEPSTDINGRSF